MLAYALRLTFVYREVLVLWYLEQIQVRYISVSTATYIPFLCGCVSTVTQAHHCLLCLLFYQLGEQCDPSYL